MKLSDCHNREAIENDGDYKCSGCGQICDIHEDNPITFLEMKKDNLQVRDTISLQQQQHNDVKSYLEKVLNDPTPVEYIGWKMNFPYLPSNYVDDRFKYWFPIHDIKVINIHVDEYYVVYTVEITVHLPGGITITRSGVGGSRLQVFEEAKTRALSGGKLTPFDYVNKADNFKSAYTLAVKNAEERYGIGGDVTERAILTPEQIRNVDIQLKWCVDNCIVSEGEKNQAKMYISSLKKPKDKLNALKRLKEKYEITDIPTNN